MLFLDIRLPDGEGYIASREIKKTQPSVRILILTSILDDQTIEQAIINGADGYLLKEIDDGQLVGAIRKVKLGGAILDSAVTRRVMNKVCSQSGKPVELSIQEQRILSLLSEGKTNKEIGVVLSLSEKTVRNYLTVAFEKLNVSNRAQAAAFFVQTRGTSGAHRWVP